MQVKLLDNETIGLFFPYDPKTVSLVKSFPGARFSASGRFWHIPVDPLAGATLQTLQGRYDVSIPEGISSRLAEFTRPLEAIVSSDLPLYPFQREIAGFLLQNRFALNASFVGSGKTLTSLAVCEQVKARQTLIIAPKSVVLQWAEVEIPKWLPERRVIPIVGTAIERNNAFVLARLLEIPYYMVIGYETARIEIDQLLQTQWDVIIADEAHKLANPQTKLYKALKKLQTKRRIALTATAVMNSPSDLFGVINWLKSESLGTYWQFAQRYLVKNMWGGVSGYKNMDELAQRCSPYIIKKTLAEVGMQLPPYTEEILPVELSESERKLYDQIKMELLFDIEKAIISKIENPVMLQLSVVKLGKLMESCDSLELLGESLESSKLEVLKEHLESTLIYGQKAIIITRFSRMVDILAKALHSYRPQVITGATNDRQTILNEFIKPGGSQLLIGTEAIGQGLNLQVANILYNYDSAWNPAKMEQRAGRIYRNGQDKPVFVYNLVVNKSVEGWLQKKLEQKKELSERLLPKSFQEIKEMLE